MKTLLKIALSGALLAGVVAASGASLAAPPVKIAPPATVAKPAAPATVVNRVLDSRTGVTGYNSSQKPTVLALTPNECKGLGGKVIASTLCKKTSLTCATVDKYGVILTACIDEADPK